MYQLLINNNNVHICRKLFLTPNVHLPMNWLCNDIIKHLVGGFCFVLLKLAYLPTTYVRLLKHNFKCSLFFIYYIVVDPSTVCCLCALLISFSQNIIFYTEPVHFIFYVRHIVAIRTMFLYYRDIVFYLIIQCNKYIFNYSYSTSSSLYHWSKSLKIEKICRLWYSNFALVSW